jgi:dTDP-4-dehydrorhamnose 3,5-epimerase
MIDGVVLANLVTHDDERGFVREIIRVTDGFFAEGFGQWGHSLMHVGVTKAWHVHKTQVDWWYIVSGLLKVALYDTRVDSPTSGELMELSMGDGRPASVLRVPPGVAHGCQALTEPVHMLYVTSGIYDPREEGRIPHDDPKIGYDWTKGTAIK